MGGYRHGDTAPYIYIYIYIYVIRLVGLCKSKQTLHQTLAIHHARFSAGGRGEGRRRRGRGGGRG